MMITSRMIFCLLFRKFTVYGREQAHKSVRVRQIRLYRGQTTEPGCLYLLDELTDLNMIGQPDGCGFVFLAGAPYKLPESFREADAVFVTDSVS